MRFICKDTHFLTACAYICEHLCEVRCRRSMVDDALNISGLECYAVGHVSDVPQLKKAPSAGKSVAIIGETPAASPSMRTWGAASRGRYFLLS